MPSKVTWRPDEPAREAAYSRLYERIVGQDDCITWLLAELRALQQRITKLEQRNDALAGKDTA
jgi:hypothetical protein